MRDAHHDLAKQRREPSIRIERETQITRLFRQTLHCLFVQPEIENRIHHAGHRERRARAHRNEQRVLRIAKLLADLLFDLLQAVLDLFPHAFGKVLVVVEEGVAGFGGHDESGRHGQSGARHLTESGAFSAEQAFVVTGAFVEEVDPFMRCWLSSFRGFFSYSAHNLAKLSDLLIVCHPWLIRAKLSSTMPNVTTLNVNGKKLRVDVDSQTPLLYVLRDYLNLTGTKYGCGEAKCGACTVLVEGQAMRSCVTPVSRVSGKQITTIEGLEKDGKLHPLQEAFLKADALQCGYCTSGMIIAAAALLNKNAKPSRDEIVKHMDANVCRCGTYARIVNAIEIAAGTAKEVAE